MPWTICARCRRRLSDDLSMRVGLGPTCRALTGWSPPASPRTTSSAAAQSSARGARGVRPVDAAQLPLFAEEARDVPQEV
jgi:hypothetical protein